MKHSVGGWPTGYDYTEANEVSKYMRKLLKDPLNGYAAAVKDLVGGATRCIK